MGFWDTMVNSVSGAVGGLFGKKPDAPGPGIANTYPLYEVHSPQYPTPNPYQLALTGYRKNEIIYACIQKRALAIAEAPMRIYRRARKNDRKGTDKELDDHPARRLLERPNEAMSETEFWQAAQVYKMVAGFSAWEIEFNNGGEPIALWPMRPDWCSFRRGEHRPLEYIRYQPYGLPPQDVPIERCLVFMEFDPIYPMLKGLSKSAIASRIGATDNAATDFMTLFFQRGAMTAGVLTSEQTLLDAEATNIRRRWRETHGGVENWTDIAVLGKGTKYQSVGMSFKEMDFSNIDGRNEARICAVFGVPTLLLGAKVGLTASTLSNFEQARRQFQEETIEPERKYFASEATSQLVSKWEDTRKVFAAYDTSRVRALQEDEDRVHSRAREDAKLNLITRDEAREMMGKDPIDNAEVFVGAALSGATLESVAPGGPPEEPEVPEQLVIPPQLQQIAQVAQQAQGQPQQMQQPQPQTEDDGGDEDKKKPADEAKALTEWRKRAIDAVKSGGFYLIDPTDTVDVTLASTISVALVDCKSAGEVRKIFERHWPKQSATLTDLVREVQLAREALEVTV